MPRFIQTKETIATTAPFNIANQFSMGLKSGELADQSVYTVEMSCFAYAILTFAV